jgi:hypothetical protein
MTIRTYYPPDIFRFLSELAFKHQLSVKEVETVMLRTKAEQLGFKCEHSRVGFAKSDRKPYCKSCWARLEVVKAPIGRGGKLEGGEYKPLPTFLEVDG